MVCKWREVNNSYVREAPAPEQQNNRTEHIKFLQRFNNRFTYIVCATTNYSYIQAIAIHTDTISMP